MANPTKLGIVDRAPGPNASQREWSEWADSVRLVIEQLKFSIQALTGNPSIGLEASTTPSTVTGGGASGGSVTSVQANGGTQVTGDINVKDGNGVDVTQSGQDFTLAADLAELGTTFLRLDAANDPMTGSLDMDDNELDNALVRVGTAAATASGEPLTILTAASAYGWQHSDGTRQGGSYIDATGLWLGTVSNHALNFFTNDSVELWRLTTGGVFEPVADNARDIGTASTRVANAYLINAHSGAALLTLATTVADGSGVVGVKFKWDVQTTTPNATAKIANFTFTDATPTEQDAFSIYPAYTHGGSGTPAVSALVKINAAAFGRMGFRANASETTFSGMEQGGSTLSFYSAGSKAFGASSGGNITLLATITSANSTDLRFNTRGSAGVGKNGFLFHRDFAITPSANQKLVLFEENLTSGGVVDRFTVFSAGMSAVRAFGADIVTIDNTDSPYTPLGTDHTILCDASSGAITVALPAVADSDKRIINIKKIDSSANAVTIDGNASETIDGATTQVITVQYNSIPVHCDGSTWWIL